MILISASRSLTVWGRRSALSTLLIFLLALSEFLSLMDVGVWKRSSLSISRKRCF